MKKLLSLSLLLLFSVDVFAEREYLHSIQCYTANGKRIVDESSVYMRSTGQDRYGKYYYYKQGNDEEQIIKVASSVTCHITKRTPIDFSGSELFKD